MTFVITYRDPHHANSGGMTIGANEPEVREAIARLRREGYEVTSIVPPPSNSGLSGAATASVNGPGGLADVAVAGAMRRADWRLVLLAWLVTLQVADIVTTKVALALPGNWEVNPAMSWCMTNLGPLGWVAPKVALVAVVIFALRRMPQWPLAIAVLVYVTIVANNLYAIALTSGNAASQIIN